MRSGKLLKKVVVVLVTLLGSQSVAAQFVERAQEVGIDHELYDATVVAGGVALFDINNDGLLDMFLAGGELTESLYINNGSGFDRKIVYLAPEDFDYFDLYVVAVASGDVNNDGYDDLLLNTISDLEPIQSDDPCILMINNGDETFDAMDPESSGIITKNWASGATMGDINEDGLSDIFISYYVDTARFIEDTMGGEPEYAHVGARNLLYINQGDNVFEERSADYGITIARNTLTSVFTDYDNDNDVDIYVINDFGEFTGPNELYRNEYPMEEVSDLSGISGANLAMYGMGIAVGDYDGDLDLDYYVTNIGQNYLLQNDRFTGFSEVGSVAGVMDDFSEEGRLVGWGTGFFDYDNDGDLDLYVSNGYLPAVAYIYNPWYQPNSLYRNNGDGTFTDVSAEMNFNDDRQFRGSAFGDLNNDGRIDVVFIGSNGTPRDEFEHLKAAVYYNMTENDNNWVKFKLTGTESNRNGFGAHLFCYDNSGRVQLRECDGGSSHASSNSPFIHYGLGTADRVDSLVIYWPNGIVQTVRDLPVNQMHEIVESDRDTAVATAAVEDVVSGEQLVVWPNPFMDKLLVDLPEDEIGGRLVLTGLDGKVAASKPVRASRERINDLNVPEGLYILHWIREDGLVTAYKVVKYGKVE